MFKNKILINSILAIVIAMFISGCGPTNPQLVIQKNSVSMMKLKIGMSSQDALNIMGVGIMEDIANPVRVEMYNEKGKEIKVAYYYTQIQKSDGAITDDELTPIIFVDDKLIGISRAILESTIKKYELRVR